MGQQGRHKCQKSERYRSIVVTLCGHGRRACENAKTSIAHQRRDGKFGPTSASMWREAPTKIGSSGSVTFEVRFSRHTKSNQTRGEDAEQAVAA